VTFEFSQLRWLTEGVRLAVLVLTGFVFLQKAGVDVIGRVRRFFEFDTPGGDWA
jgi:hypothetical protein